MRKDVGAFQEKTPGKGLNHPPIGFSYLSNQPSYLDMYFFEKLYI